MTSTDPNGEAAAIAAKLARQRAILAQLRECPWCGAALPVVHGPSEPENQCATCHHLLVGNPKPDADNFAAQFFTQEAMLCTLRRIAGLLERLTGAA